MSRDPDGLQPDREHLELHPDDWFIDDPAPEPDYPNQHRRGCPRHVHLSQRIAFGLLPEPDCTCGVPTPWEHQRSPCRNWGCLWALAATALFWAVVVAWWLL